MIKTIFSALLIITVTVLPAFADGYMLNYQKQNRWVAQEDAKGLRAMLKDAKKQKISHFYVQLPTGKREVTIERLIVLRDILQKQLGKSIVIEEMDKISENNQVIVQFTK